MQWLRWTPPAARASLIGLGTAALVGAAIVAASHTAGPETRRAAPVGAAAVRVISSADQRIDASATPDPTPRPTPAVSTTAMPPPASTPRAVAPSARPAPPPIHACRPADFTFTAQAESPDVNTVGTWAAIKTTAGTCQMPYWSVTLHLADSAGQAPSGFPSNDGNFGPGQPTYPISQGYRMPGPVHSGPHQSVPAGSYTMWLTSDTFGTTGRVTVTLD